MGSSTEQYAGGCLTMVGNTLWAHNSCNMLEYWVMNEGSLDVSTCWSTRTLLADMFTRIPLPLAT
jgi:hypothetical protein